MAVIHQPVGVVAAFSAWNFPALLPARKIAAALGAGCSIIIKPAGETPASCAALVQACHDAGIPQGVVNMLTGNSQHDRAAPDTLAHRAKGLRHRLGPVGKQILRWPPKA
jgi:succinate-semialdehyde dehydrogenase / glutarate-semialdehyde dehydrogenase